MIMKVLVSDSLAEDGVKRLQSGADVDVITNLSPEELIQKIPDYDALVIRSGTKVTADVINAAKRLKVIGRAGVGIDNVDVEAATKKGIIVLNTPGGNTISAAEHTIAMMLALARNIPQANSALHQGEWNRKKYTGVHRRRVLQQDPGRCRSGPGWSRGCSTHEVLWHANLSL